jgi:hypothetical protein
MAKITRWPHAGRIVWRRASLTVTEHDRVREEKINPIIPNVPGFLPAATPARASGAGPVLARWPKWTAA